MGVDPALRLGEGDGAVAVGIEVHRAAAACRRSRAAGAVMAAAVRPPR